MTISHPSAIVTLCWPVSVNPQLTLAHLHLHPPASYRRDDDTKAMSTSVTPFWGPIRCQLLGYSHMLLRQPGLEIPQEWTGQRGECPFPQGYPIVSINIGGVWGPSGTFSNLYRGLNCTILRLFWGILQGEWTNSKGDFGDSPG
ncbi:hypothetical protein BKA83DRAFT_4123626 [Pisolithus microcarpus]|nr:hypothetical protein BKA83DRAFT_4123626 [Pisolithus microcarpus]